jgi:hypothetical protein
MMKKIETNGNQMFNVPNTQEGKDFIRQLREYSNNKNFRPRGRGSRKHSGDGSYIPLPDAEWYAVYVLKTKADKKRERQEKQNLIKYGKNRGKKEMARTIVEALCQDPDIEQAMFDMVEPQVRMDLEEYLCERIQKRTEARVRKQICDEIMESCDG